MSETHSVLSFSLTFVSSNSLQGTIFPSEANQESLLSEEESKTNSEATNGPSSMPSISILEKTPPINEIKPIRKKIFSCNFDGCLKSFDQKWILDRHVSSHFPFRHFKCEYEDCSKAYKSKENLLLHQKNKHLGVKPYQCRFCQLKFSHRNGRIFFNVGKTYHERREHINYLPYKCMLEKCKLSFASKSALNYHMDNQH